MIVHICLHDSEKVVMHMKYELKQNNDINDISSASCAGNYIVCITNFKVITSLSTPHETTRDSHVTEEFNLWVDSQTAVAAV